MRKLFFLIVSVVFAVATVNAQRVFNISGVSKGGKTCTIVVNGKTYEVNPYLYKRVKANPAAYVFVEYIDEVYDEWTIALKEKVTYSVTAVDSIGIDDNDNPEVYLSDSTIYRSQNENWLRVNVGQHVAKWFIDGETKGISRVCTVPRDVALTSEVPVESGAPVVNQVDDSLARDAAPAQAQTKTATPDTKDVAANTPPSTNTTTPTQPIRLIRR